MRRSLFAPVFILSVVACSPELHDLAKHHETSNAPPVLVMDGGKVAVESAWHRGMSTFRGVRKGFTAKGLFLELGPTGFKTRLWIPVSAIRGCSRTQWSLNRWGTNFWVEDSKVLIEMP